jgi:hypothetical protein
MKQCGNRSWEVEGMARGWNSIRRRWCNHTSESAEEHRRADLEWLKMLDVIQMQRAGEQILRVEMQLASKKR